MAMDSVATPGATGRSSWDVLVGCRSAGADSVRARMPTGMDTPRDAHVVVAVVTAAEVAVPVTKVVLDATARPPDSALERMPPLAVDPDRVFSLGKLGSRHSFLPSESVTSVDI